MSRLEVLVTLDSPVDVGTRPVGVDGDSVLLLHPYQSHEYAVQEVSKHLPAMPLDEVVALVRRYLPDAISVMPTQDPPRLADPAPSYPSTTRTTLGVVGLLASIVMLPLLALFAADTVQGNASNDDARALLRAFEVKCWGKLQFDRRMGCAAEQDSIVVTLTHAEETGLVMLMEEDTTASMVVQMSSPTKASDAIEHGLGRMLVGENPTAVGPYIVTSTDAPRQRELETLARRAAMIANLPNATSLQGPASPQESAEAAGSVSITRVGDRPIMRLLGITSPQPHPAGSVSASGRPAAPPMFARAMPLPSDVFMTPGRRDPSGPEPHRSPEPSQATQPSAEPVPVPSPAAEPAPAQVPNSAPAPDPAPVPAPVPVVTPTPTPDVVITPSAPSVPVPNAPVPNAPVPLDAPVLTPGE